MKKFQVIFRTRDCGITAKRIYVSAEDVTAALQTAKNRVEQQRLYWWLCHLCS